MKSRPSLAAVFKVGIWKSPMPTCMSGSVPDIKKAPHGALKKVLQCGDYGIILLYTPWAGRIFSLPRKKFFPAQKKIFL